MTDKPLVVATEEVHKDVAAALRVIVQALKRQPGFDACNFDFIISDAMRDKEEGVRSLLRSVL